MDSFAENKNKLKQKLSNVDQKTLRFLYDKYLARFFQDNSQIFKNIPILIFINLIPMLSTLMLHKNDYSPIMIKIISVISICSSLVWLVNVEVHRSFQNKSAVWLMAIEEKLIGQEIEVPPKIADDCLNKWLGVKLKLKWMIRIFVFIYIACWGIIFWKVA